MKLVVIGGLLLLVGTPLAAYAPGAAFWSLLVFIGVVETLFGALYWWWTRRRGHWPLRGSEQGVVLAAVGLMVADVLTLLGGALGIAGVLLWWIFALVFVLLVIAWWRAARRRAAAALAPDTAEPPVLDA
jgi:hypothetical protein